MLLTLEIHNKSYGEVRLSEGAFLQKFFLSDIFRQHSERGLKFFPVQWHNKIQKDEPLLKDGLEECTVYKKFYLSA